MKVIARYIEEAIGFDECQNIDLMAIDALNHRGTFEKPFNKWFEGRRAQIINGNLFIEHETKRDAYVLQGKVDRYMEFTKELYVTGLEPKDGSMQIRKVACIKTWHDSIKIFEIREV